MISSKVDGRASGIPVLGDLPWGTHFCQFYQSKQHLIDVLVPYFKAGLENDEFCVWVTSDALKSDEAREALATAVPDLVQREASGQLEIFPYDQWYTAGGFDMHRVLDGWRRKYEQGIGKGFVGLRVSGNTAWLEGKDWDSFSAYEQSIDGAIEGSHILVLCTYSLDRCGPYELLDVVRNHQFALVLGQRGWEQIENAEARRLREMHKATEGRYRQLFSSMSEGFALHEIICNEQGEPVDYRFLDVNPAFERLTGLRAETTIGKRVTELLPGIERTWIERYGKVALTGEPARFRQYAEPLNRWFEVFAYRPAPGEFGAMFMDVTEAQEAQTRLRETAEELSRSNHELQQFAYVASHDLQEPLRMVSGFLGMLRLRYGDKLQGKGQDYIGFAVEGAERMSHLIRDLLEYSRVQRSAAGFLPVDMNIVFDQAVANCMASIGESLAQTSREKLPTVQGDSMQLLQLVQNWWPTPRNSGVRT